jgi:deoxyribonuclease IV
MKYFGAHVSISGGVQNAPLNAVKIGAKSFGMFSKNQRRWDAKPLDEKDIILFKENLKKSEIKPEHVLVHDSYLINLGNKDPEKNLKSYNAFIDEINRVDQLGLKLLNFHPGSHLKQFSEDDCIKLIGENLNRAVSSTKNVVLVIETTAGQGTNIGYEFEHIAKIIEIVENKQRVGVCIDTCHSFCAGYDIRTEKTYEKTFEEFDKIVGYKYLKGMHLNDSKNDLSTRKDRHESLGKGFIGEDTFKFIANDENLSNIPLILETPNSDIWNEEIKNLYGYIK